MTMRLQDLRIKLFTDGADKAQILDMARKPWIRGFTTNPSLLRKAGVADYEAYGRDLTAIKSFGRCGRCIAAANVRRMNSAFVRPSSAARRARASSRSGSR